jgi:two-component system response regulator DevR
MSAQAPAAPPTRVLLVDDHEVVRVGLRTLLGQAPDIAVVGEAATAAQALQEAQRLVPDVVVLDVRLPDASGVEVCRELRAQYPSVKVIILTSYNDEDALFAAILAGASGYLLKQARARDLVEAIRTVRTGRSLLDPAVTDRVLRRLRDPALHSEHGPLAELSPIEQRILDLLAQGKTNREIAQVVYLSDKTVKHHVSHILRKLGAARRSEAAALWARSHPQPPPTG